MSQTMKNVTILRAACCVAGLDAEICEKERPMLEKLAEYAGVGKASLQAMIDRARTDPNYYQDQFRLFATDPEATITTLFVVACADGKLASAERIILHHFAEKLGLPEAKFEAILKAAEKKIASEPAQGSA